MDPRLWRLRAKSNKSTFLIPSTHYLGSPDLIKVRHDLTSKTFIEKALKGVRCEDGRHNHFFSVRRAVLEDINKAIKDPSLHFDRYEVSTLLNVYYTLTNYEVRGMKQAELMNFLYLTLNITNMSSLQGLYRAGMKLTGRGNSKIMGTFDSLAFVRLMSVLLRGSIEERAVLSFYVLDENDDGLITAKTEIAHSLRSSFNTKVAASAPEIDPEEPSRDTLRYLTKKMGLSVDGGLNLEEFVNECLVSPWLIDGILPNLPSEISNYAFQCLVSQVPTLPLIENRAARNKSIVNIKKRKRKDE
ncbi:EF-hand calcium-binding domain-containing protein 1 [Echinococcus granulosus]|uniref:EF-hand calcium-binding domain-containing protein n=1 Tax=Echinococcus granulosus TaxID=6210 RepID=U6IU00_ECHGR|nr:EF-hand calcium-binding domain-containing protein [Echinococcus granulosus]EUB59139.1 EF-hand calcium-binding domain-containing protein [Echinococcus granulosus]KAH9287105.1 EF-hand calcium-binding domain-containing protein 1 [Echinococcus granulosus]CDS15176.1 EF hand calcium binding domain containing protein [Echinococcus granulosus]